MSARIYSYLNLQTKAAPLAVFRILFGLLMALSLVRFWYHGWIEKLYLTPSFHFKYLGFEWVSVPGEWTYALFMICFIAAIMVSLGLFYPLAITTFFCVFTYIELLDKTTYLNHYYFISVLSFLLIWLPAGSHFSIDSWRNRSASNTIPKWTIDALKILLAIVYIYAGLAKLNGDWLLRAMPLAIWLPTKFELPLLGSLMHERWLHYLFSWGGAIYDLCIVFLLLNRRTRWLGFGLVIMFHLLTRALFPIGMFPYIMIFSTLIYFSPEYHERLLAGLRSLFPRRGHNLISVTPVIQKMNGLKVAVVASILLLQIILPWRYLLCPGSVFWHEQGYRFSWRVMLMEKTGYASFTIVNGETGQKFVVQNHDFLTAFQQKQMATQPDFIVEYGQYLGRHFAEQGHEHVEVYVESYAALNGRPHQTLVDPQVDLMKVNRWTFCRTYVKPLITDS